MNKQKGKYVYMYTCLSIAPVVQYFNQKTPNDTNK